MAPHTPHLRIDAATTPFDGPRPELSVVIPVYRGADTIGPLVDKLLEHLGDTYRLEIVLVNDGSPDHSAEVCRRLAHTHAAVRFVNLARNFSEHNAVMAGLNHAQGDAIVIMDDDFQNPPGEVIKLVAELQRGYDVVYSYYEKKRHSTWRNWGSKFNNLVASVMLDKPRDLYLSSFKALNRFTVEQITKYDGPYPYIDGLILQVTRSISRVLVEHDPRQTGKSGYTLRKLISLWLNMFTNFSVLPLRFASAVGFVFAFLGLVMGVYCLIERIQDPDQPVGWASLMVTVLVIGGVQLFALGMIGEYLGRLFLKQNGRPQFVVRERVDGVKAETQRKAA
ncbi:MAG: glycosyltransferase family 2 protein [Planctomycetaceae bacterium]|nr:glycosyltransferase family 2 protein [Planctomycetaceae bacterium]